MAKITANKLIVDFFNGEIEGESLFNLFQTDEPVNGADLVDLVGEFFEECKKQGVL